MSTQPTIACARCATSNYPASRFCSRCGLPLGAAQPDADAGLDALGACEAPDLREPDVTSAIGQFVAAAGTGAVPFGFGWRVVVPLEHDRHQAVYIGPAGSDCLGRSLLSLVSVCGPATDRDAWTLLEYNARVVDGHFAIKTLRGESYFVVIRNISAEAAPCLDAVQLVADIAQLADGLEARLSRGQDRY